jgi:hypothetical protein
MEAFTYEPIDLDRPAFRLLRLCKGEEFDGIQCEIFQAWLHGDDFVPYHALSYVWGDATLSSTVTIDGRTLGVTENLHLALAYLRREEVDRILWIDAICIDQGNKKERGHQVQQMGEIYSQAEEVIFWLGRGTYETAVLMDSLNQLEEQSLLCAHKTWNLADKGWVDLWQSLQPGLRRHHSDLANRQRRGLEFLLRRSYFKRVWILQEVANAKKAVLCSGSRSISAHIFALAPLLVHTRPKRHCQAVLDIMPGTSRKTSWWGESRDLYTLLLKFGGSEASDPRDMIYALLGISSDAQDTNILRPDYTKDIQDVIRDTTAFLFRPSIVSYATMPRFLGDLPFLNVTHFNDIVKTSDLMEVADSLKKRGLHMTITEDTTKAAARNETSGKEILELLLQQRGVEVKVTEEVVKAAAENKESGKTILELLLQQRGAEVKVTGEIVKAAARNQKSGKELLELLLQQRGAKVEWIVKVLVLDAEVEAFSFRRRVGEVTFKEEVIRTAARNCGCGAEIIEFLLQRCGTKVRREQALRPVVPVVEGTMCFR